MDIWHTAATGLAVLVMHGAPTPAFAQENQAEITVESSTPKALLIDIDGVRWDKLLQADTPNMDALALNGQLGPTQTHTTDLARTDSGPGHANILTGVWPDKHQVTDNSFADNNLDEYPDLLTRAEEQRPRLETFSILDWEPLNEHLIDSPDLKLRQPTTGGAIASDDRTADTVTQMLNADDPDLGFVYFHEPDERGHNAGSESEEYTAAIERVDAHIGDLVAAAHSRATADEEDWLFVVTTDHGFDGHEHGTDAATVREIWSLASGGDTEPRGMVEQGHSQVEVLPTIYDHLALDAGA